MAKIIDYVVITSTKGVENLESLIKENINRGWQPIGGVAIINATPDSQDASLARPVTFAQAIVLYDNY